MEFGIVSKVFRVNGMTCPSCELKIENGLKKLTGVKVVKASLSQSAVEVTYEPARLNPEELEAVINQLGYAVDSSEPQSGKIDAKAEQTLTINQLLGIGIILFAFYWMINATVGFNFIPEIDQSLGFGMLFIVGLLTSLHCIAMCGGINLSQSLNHNPREAASGFAKFKPSLLYNTGRVISYTLLGGIVGALGSVVSFSGAARGIVAIVGGIFMVLMGIKMLDVFPVLRKLTISVPKFFGHKIYDNIGRRGPFFIGLLNGLMPCGPLQTMQLYALGTGSFFAGAASMFLFSLGTMPLMFGFGALSTLLSSKFTHRMLKVGAVLVIILGFTMINRGLSLSGRSLALGNPRAGTPGIVARIDDGVQEVTTTIESGRYQPFMVQKGIPVRWTIKAKAEDLNGCNNPVTIPQYNIQKRLVPGDNVIEFTPAEEGSITYTCWMGMIRSNIKVVSDLGNVSRDDLEPVDIAGDGGELAGGCCADSAKATQFYGGRIPADKIEIAKLVDGIQEAVVAVNDEGYSPAVVVLQRGVKAKINFNPEKVNSCNYAVVFPEYRGQLDLSQGQTATPPLEVTQDFIFQCWMGMLHGYVKVVDNLNEVDVKAIQKEVEGYRAAGGGGCCGGGSY